jgi:hypothetical protein
MATAFDFDRITQINKAPQPVAATVHSLQVPELRSCPTCRTTPWFVRVDLGMYDVVCYCASDAGSDTKLRVAEAWNARAG